MLRNGNLARRRGATLVELLIALTVVAVLSTAVTMLIAAAGQTHQFVNNETDAMSQVENGYRRMIHNIRTSSVAPTAAANVLKLQSQPDSGSAYAGRMNTASPSALISSAGAVVIYKKDASGNLVEVDDRFGTNILIPASASPSFTATVSGSGPTQVNIAITAFPGTQYQTKRTVTIACRNF